MTFESLKTQTAAGEIDTVLVCVIDMQGRLMGKRFHAQAFVDSGHAETHCCTYLLATDLEMATPEGYAATSWAKRLWGLRDAPRPDHIAPDPVA